MDILRKNEDNWRQKSGRYISVEHEEDLSNFWSCPKIRFFLTVLPRTGAVQTGSRQPVT